MITFFVFLFCLFATYAGFLLVTRKKAAQRAKLEQRLVETLGYAANATEQQIRLAKVELLSESRFSMNGYAAFAPRSN